MVAVNIISEKPSGEAGFKGEVTLGTRDDGRALAVIDVPKSSGFSAKVSLLATNLDGYVRNPGVGSNYQDFGIMRQQAGKLQLRYDDQGPLHCRLLLRALRYPLDTHLLRGPTPRRFDSEVTLGPVSPTPGPIRRSLCR